MATHHMSDVSCVMFELWGFFLYMLYFGGNLPEASVLDERHISGGLLTIKVAFFNLSLHIQCTLCFIFNLTPWTASKVNKKISTVKKENVYSALRLSSLTRHLSRNTVSPPWVATSEHGILWLSDQWKLWGADQSWWPGSRRGRFYPRSRWLSCPCKDKKVT